MSEKNLNGLEVDELYLGMTRPATVFGVPLTAFVAEMLVVAVIFLAIGNALWLLLVVPVHAVLFLMSATDPGRFESWAMFFKTFGRCTNAMFWKSASYSPLRSKRYDTD